MFGLLGVHPDSKGVEGMRIKLGLVLCRKSKTLSVFDGDDHTSDDLTDVERDQFKVLIEKINTALK